MSTDALKEKIEEAWENRELLKEKGTLEAIDETISLLDQGVALNPFSVANGK
jgi:2,3,4,5-tetrahydropyridine-2,6-dicarboxylate N-succinyltransferase